MAHSARSTPYATGLLLAGLLALASPARAQTDLLNDLEKQTADSAKSEVVAATFKGTHIINAQSVETTGPGMLAFLIQHRFGTLNSGAYNFFGLDQAVLRLSFEYGITSRLAAGIGRSSQDKTFDGFLKYRALRQTTGPHAVPVSVTLLASSAITTLRFNDPTVERTPASRLEYVYQALIARKVSPDLSVQLMPTLVHRNFVATPAMQNDVYAIGAGLRQKLTKRIAFTADYFYLLPGNTADTFRNALGVGVDIETGGHVFQLHFTNSKGMTEKFFVPQTDGNFFKGDIYFGFTIVRNFTIKSQI
ncbi:DUF5777 family beta-barrel protein [Hymenobacter sp. BT770]|uniref:DUF5777 family beta-barrel protein n=1 Tax=Hymenobacter sp. BT770 TaxID=2886942 RepID=UPI001D116E35|nr:DUF5777 family beta-barrel protein [Hymenobacter sp. BT770]MCC3151804.1 DUF5777 family beta-barrel protein [Hymenobacter sp. BT770]MDO3413574.1 DUF5777 family beta-barrel protein [Hymenobacter sp. BT770]